MTLPRVHHMDRATEREEMQSPMVVIVPGPNRSAPEVTQRGAFAAGSIEYE
jgi:hypothetical protein